MRSRRTRAARLLTITAAVPAAALVALAGNAHAAVSGAVSNGTLTITGDAASDRIFLRLKAGDANTLEIDLGDDGSADLSFDRSAFTKIVVNAGAGNDVVGIREGNGSFTDSETTTINGQDGDDALGDGSFSQTLSGGPGNDSLVSFADSDILIGGNGADVFSPNAGTDVIDGGGGTDLVGVNGGSPGPDNITVKRGSVAGHVTAETDISSPDLVSVEALQIETFAGDDTINAIDLPGSLSLNVSAGDGNDRIFASGGHDNLRGGNGGDVVVGGSGNDTITGGPGLDSLIGGTGNDAFVHDAGDGDDEVDGEDGTDTQTVNGSDVAETFNLFEDAGRVRLTRDIGGALNMATVETLAVNTFAGRDRVNATRDLAGVARVDLALEVANDGQNDTIVIAGTQNRDNFTVKRGAVDRHLRVSSGSGRPVYDVVGANETNINAAGADDVLSSSLPSTPFFTVLSLRGEDGNDSITSGANSENLLGGDGNDTLLGGGGIDVLLGEGGDDKLSGEGGNDALDGGPGIDRLEGGAGADTIACGGPGDNVIFDPLDIIAPDCK
jgi:Ca2+-binding RTX toxin-like protein